MRGAISPLPQYAFVVWYSVKKSTGITTPCSELYFYPYLFEIYINGRKFAMYYYANLHIFSLH